MNRSFRWIAAAGLAAGLLGPQARADWKTMWHHARIDYYRVNAWPAPFNFVDRDQVRAPFAAMVVKGWQRQNTLGDFYFHPETQNLTEAGRLKVYEILTQNPPQFRTIYIVRGQQARLAEARIRQVQQLAQQWAGPDAQVLPTTLEPPGWSAEYINAIDNKMMQSIPDPVLPEVTTTSGN